MFDPKRLYDIVESRSDLLAQTLLDLIRFQTVSGMTEPAAIEKFERETRRCLDYLRLFAEQNHFAYREHPAGVAVIEWGRGDQTIGFATHTDIVPPGGRWRHSAFDGEIKGDRIYGRGAQDNKGPLACGLVALLAVAEIGLPARRKVRLIFGTREEPGDWSDVAGYLPSEPEPLYCIVPDANFPIINGEKGMATLKLQPTATCPLERKDGLRLDSIRAGERFNIVPDRAVVQMSGPLERKEALLAELKAECESYEKSRLIMLDGPPAVRDKEKEKRFLATWTFLGKSAHGSRPLEGHNAAVDALGYLVRLDFPPCPAQEFIGMAYCAGKDIYGEYLGIDSWHEFIGETTASLNVFELDAHGGQALVNARFALGVTSAELIERVQRRLAVAIHQPEHRPSVTFDGIVHEPLYVNPDDYPEFFAALREAYQSVTGREPRLKAAGGTTYAKAFPHAVSFGPIDEQAGERDLAHKADEFVTRPVLVRNAKIYAHALAALALER